MPEERIDFDSPWKEIIERYFPQFMAFFFPAIAADDAELHESQRDAAIGRHTVDKLVEVRLKNGDDVWLLIHIEVQSQVDKGFARRMFVSNYRIFDLHGKEVVSLAILADESKTWRPAAFGYGRWGSEMGLRFPTVKLLDYAARWDELAANPNPFAIVVMAHVKSQATRRKPADRLGWKLDLVKLLYARGYERQDVLEFFRFIDWVLALSQPLELSFREEIRRYEGGERMRYVTSIERLAKQEGREEGSLGTARTMVGDVLTLRFRSVPPELLAEIDNISEMSRLKELLREAVSVGSIEEFERNMEDTGAHPT